MPPRAEFITVTATEIRQSKGKKIYSFAIDGKKIPSFAAISRLKRGSDTKLSGYQRPEVISHINEIRTYLEGPSAMIPNGIVLALDSSVKFTPAPRNQFDTKFSRMGTLRIPIPREASEPKPGFIVDGQQRVAAIRDAQIKEFPMFVTAFITGDIAEQTEQFILVNATKPLNRGLIHELLPYTEARLPSALHKRRLAAQLLEVLNHTESSPFFRMIQTPTTPKGIVKDNSILRMLEQSLSDGVLFRLRRVEAGQADISMMTSVLFSFWWAVHDVFSGAWRLPPRRSRLMHGAGIMSVGNLMDHIGIVPTRSPSRAFYQKCLATIEPTCAWTEGEWGFRSAPRHWNEIQNTRQDVALLTEYLQHQYDLLCPERQSPVR